MITIEFLLIFILLMWSLGLLSVGIISLSGVTGAVLWPIINSPLYNQLMTALIGLAVGSLTSTALFQLIPEKGLISVFFSCGSKPLAEWRQCIKTGFLRRITDEQIRSLVLEIMSVNIVNTYITSPPDDNESLGIKLPFLVLLLKNLSKYFSFEITVLDDRNMKRRFRVSNYQSKTRIGPFRCNMPIGLNPGWNQVQFNLAEFTQKAYGSSYVETTRLTIHANCRLRRIYFADRLFDNDELPQDYKLFRAE